MIEPQLPSQLNVDDSERDLHPGEYRHATNLTVLSGNTGGIRKAATLGTTLAATFVGLLDGAKNIGSVYQDTKRRAVFFFWQNNAGDECVIFEADATLNPTNPVITKIATSKNMGVKSNSYVNNARIVGSLLVFNFGESAQYVINIDRAKANPGFYDSLSEETLSMSKSEPFFAPIATRTNSAAPTIDPAIYHKAFQFCIRFLFIDGEQSDLSPASDIIPAIDVTPTIAGNDVIDVQVAIQPSMIKIVDSVEIFVRNNNNPSSWRSIAMVDASTFVLSTDRFLATYRFDDKSSGLLLSEDEALKMVNSEPRNSSSLEVINGRVFLTDDLVDYNEEDGWDIVLTPSTSGGTRDNRAGHAGSLIGYAPSTFQWDSEYNAGLIYRDKFGRRIPSPSKNKSIKTPAYPLINTPGVDGISDAVSSSALCSLTVSGKPPSYATSMIVARSKNITWDWQIMNKCLIRFPYSIVPWDGVLALPARTFKEDGYIYWDLETALVGDVINGEYIDIVVPTNFPFTIDNNVIIDMAIKAMDYNGGAPLANAISITNRTVVSIFANKIRIKGDSKAAWGGNASLGIYKSFPKFVSGVNLSAGQNIKNSESFYPIIFKRKAASNIEADFLYDQQEFPILNPGASNRAFSGAPVPAFLALSAAAGAPTADITINAGELLVQPIHVVPSSLAFNHRITVNWHGLAADSTLFVARAVLYSLDQTTKAPIAELAHSADITGITNGASTYFIGALPELPDGWYGYGIKVVSVNIQDFVNNEFNSGLASWVASFWNPTNSGVDFFIESLPLAASAVSTPVSQYLFGLPYVGMMMEIDIETFNVVGLPTLVPYTRQPNVDGSSSTFDVNEGDIFVVPMLLDTFHKLILPASSITAFFTGGVGDGAGYFAVGQVWQLDQTTKQPVSLLYQTPTPVELNNISQTFDFVGSPEITTSAWYGIGIKITTAPPHYEFADNDFEGDFSNWIPDAVSGGGTTNWFQGAGFAQCIVPPGELDTFGLMPVSGLPSCYGVNISAQGNLGTIYFLDESLNVLGSVDVFSALSGSTVIFSRPLNPGERFMMKYQAWSLSGVNQRVKIDSISNLYTQLYVKQGAPATADNKFWKYRSSWSQDATHGMPFSFFAEDSYNLAPTNLTLSLDGMTGAPVVLAPNARAVVNLTPTSQPAFDLYGLKITNNVSNSSAQVRIRYIKNIKTISAPLSVKSFAFVSANDKLYKYTGAWNQIAFVSEFLVNADDWAYGASLVTQLRPDCYHLAQNYLEKGVTGHSTDWAPTDQYTQGFPFPSLSSYPDLKGLAYQDKIAQGIGAANAVVKIKERQQSYVVRWSDNIILGSQLNNINQFREANKFTIGFERGRIRKLLAMNNRTLVCIHETGMTSLYINKKIITQLTGPNFLSLTDQEVGDDLELFTDLGTVNPESCIVVENGTVAYGFDLRRASAWQKTNNGVRNLTTEGKMTKWFSERSNERIAAMNAGVDIKIHGGYNVKIKTYFLTFDEFTYLGITYPAYTIGWSSLLRQGQGGWLSFYDFIPDNYVYESNYLFTVNGNKLWLHDEDGFSNKFYGIQYSSSITMLFKGQDTLKKIFNNIAIDSDSPWKVTSIRTSSGAESALGYVNFKIKNGRYYADFLRDKNTPADVLQVGQTPLLHGFPLTGNWIELTLVNETTTERAVIDGVYVGFDPISGHLLHK